MRVWLRSQGQAYDGEALLETLERNADTVSALTPNGADRDATDNPDRALHPFFGSEAQRDPGRVLEYFSTTPSDEAFEVLFVGGSVAMLFCVHAGEELEAALAADPRLAGKKVKLLRGAHAAYKQPQQLNKVAYLFAHGYKPDVVVNLDGFNELAYGLQNGLTGTYPLYPAPAVWGGLLWGRSDADPVILEGRNQLRELTLEYRKVLDRAHEWNLMNFAISGLFVSKQLGSTQRERAALQDALIGHQSQGAPEEFRTSSRELRGDLYAPDEAAIVDLSVQSWIQCSISLNAICKARGVQYLHALQPTLWDEGAKPVVRRELKFPGPAEFRRAVALGYPKLREAIPKLEAAGVSMLDLSMNFSEVHEPLYFDYCHFREKGANLLVEDLAGGVLRLLP